MPHINEKTFYDTSSYGYELFKRKNADYGDSVEKSVLKYGLLPNLIRLDDKINRAEQLLQRPAMVADEKLFDTLVDLGNYAYMLATFIKHFEEECEVRAESPPKRLDSFARKSRPRREENS